jgi:hypothetical protein
MTTKELLALVGKWQTRAEFVMHPQATIYAACANELAPIATALCAEVEAQAQRIAQQDATIARLRVSLALGGAALASDTGERGVVEITVGAGVHATDLWLREVGIGGSLVYVPLDTSSETVAALGAAINPRAALRAQPAGGGVELKLRRLLAMRVAGAMLYTDDGELSDGTEHPAIDFLRHSPEEIESLLRRRAELKAAIATLTPPESGGQGVVMVPREASMGIRGVLYRTRSGYGDDYMTPEQADALWADLLAAAPAQPDGVGK